MNRLNLKLRDVLTRYLKWKKEYYDMQNIKTELTSTELTRIEFGYQVAIEQAYKWCTIVETIRKGYKKVRE